MASPLKQTYEGRQLSQLVASLSAEQMENTFGLPATAFEGFVVVGQDIVNAVPSDLLGIINAAATRLNLINTNEVDLLRDAV